MSSEMTKSGCAPEAPGFTELSAAEREAVEGGNGGYRGYRGYGYGGYRGYGSSGPTLQHEAPHAH